MKDVERWLTRGFIDKELAQKLEDDLKQEAEKKRKIAAQIVLYTIGIILFGTGVITFVAANDWLLEFLKSTPALQIFILFSFAAVSLWSGWKIGYEKKNFPRFGGALIFLSTLLIGASYIQIGQIYHWDINTSLILSLWFASIFPLAFIFKSKPVNWLAIILFVTVFPYFYYEWNLDTIEVWTIFMPVSLFGLLYNFANVPVVKEKFNDFSLSYKITGLIPLFFTFLILIFSVQTSYRLADIHYLIIPALIILFSIFNYCSDKNIDTLKKTETGFIILLMLFMEIMLVISGVNKFAIMFLAHIALIFIISESIYWGYKFEKVQLINLGNFFLLTYLLSIYCRYGWSYLDKTIFFLLGGIGLVGLGIFLEKDKNKRLGAKN